MCPDAGYFHSPGLFLFHTRVLQYICPVFKVILCTHPTHLQLAKPRWKHLLIGNGTRLIRITLGQIRGKLEANERLKAQNTPLGMWEYISPFKIFNQRHHKKRKLQTNISYEYRCKNLQ